MRSGKSQKRRWLEMTQITTMAKLIAQRQEGSLLNSCPAQPPQIGRALSHIFTFQLPQSWSGEMETDQNFIPGHSLSQDWESRPFLTQITAYHCLSGSFSLHSLLLTRHSKAGFLGKYIKIQARFLSLLSRKSHSLRGNSGALCKAKSTLKKNQTVNQDTL